MVSKEMRERWEDIPVIEITKEAPREGPPPRPDEEEDEEQ